MSTILIPEFANDEGIWQLFPIHRKLLIVVLFLGALSQVHADKVDAYVKAEMEKNHIPGLALAVVKDGKNIKAKGYGLANVELDVPATADSVFGIASITKPFTALAVMMLVEQGKLGLDETIGKYLTNAPNTWSNITARHLLTHTAGLRGGGGGPQTNANQGRWNVKTSIRYEALRNRPLVFQPGERWQYSGTGYFLLGVVIERISGQSYRDFLPARIFGPAGMTSTFISDADKIVKSRAGSYVLREGELIRAWGETQVELPADGGIISSVNDLARWEMALYSEKLVKRSTLEQMWKPPRMNDGIFNDEAENGYALGWGVHDHRGHRMISHAGSSGADFLSFPDDKLTVIVLCNLAGADAHALAQAVAGIYNHELVPPHMLKPKPDPAPDVTERLLGFLSDYASDKESRLAAPGLRVWLNRYKSGYPEYFATYVLAPLSAKLKERASFTFVACDEVEGRGIEHLGSLVNRICYFKLVTTKKTFHYTFWLTASGQIADFAPKD
jgi:D-alanyl-D-alanine carboxypeptidase